MINSDTHSWAHGLFGEADLGDKRRTSRLVHVASALAQNTGKSLVKSSHSPAEVEGAYRLLRNESVDAESIARAGFESCAKYAQEHSLLLALEDTTTLQYSHKSVQDELGHVTSRKHRRGLFAHSVLLFSPETGQVVGLIEQHRWTRSLKSYGKKAKRNKTPYKDKESYKWERASVRVAERLGDVMEKVVSVCDREADIYEYLLYKQSNGQRFVVRAAQNRQISESDKRLFSFSETLKSAGKREVKIAQKGGRKARTARLQVRFAQVQLCVPGYKSGQAVPLFYVCCTEKGDSGLCWHLLTSEPVTNAEQAQQIVGFYERRWLIEDYHKAWKSGGTAVESQRMQSLSSLERMIVILSFVAARVLQLRYIGIQGKHSPDKSCEPVLSTLEWKLLWLKQESKPLPKKPPSLYWAYINLAKLAGWQDSKQTGRVGWQTLWEGWFNLQFLVEGSQLTKSLDHEM